MFSLTGRVALVTGSGRGVGAEIARTFARQGARIVVNDIDDDRSRHVVEEINAAGGMAVAARAIVPLTSSRPDGGAMFARTFSAESGPSPSTLTLQRPIVRIVEPSRASCSPSPATLTWTCLKLISA